MASQVVFNLYPFNESLYLPSANIVEVDERGQLKYLVQRATVATVEPYGLEMTEPLTRLLGIIDSLEPKSLESKFKPPKAKTAVPLDRLLADKDIKPVAERFIFNNLDAFFSEITHHNFSLTLDLKRKSWAKDVQVLLSEEPLVPHLFFKKTSEGIEYRLQLGTEEKTYNLREHNVLPLTNTDPAWLLVDYTLFRVPGINGNMVNPFRQKDAVQIPPDKERVYFKFIAKSIRRSNVEAEGFEIEKTDNLRITRLEAVENVLENRWQLRPVFEYEGAEFPYGDRRDRVTSLDIPEDEQGEITVHLISRNEKAEREQIDFLKKTGLEEDGKMFAVNGADEHGLASILNFLTRHRRALEAARFAIVAPQIEGKTLALAAHDINVRSEAAGDWFDVQGRVAVGEYSFPFQKLLPNLRSSDPYFPLPDGTFFLIPAEWFARYADLAGTVQEHGEQLRLPKALYTVLQESRPDRDASNFPDIDPEKIDYQSSANLNATLRPYQLAGVKWLIGHYQQGFGACLADDMGLGKTLQTIAVLLFAKENSAPSSTPPPTPPLKGRGDVEFASRTPLPFRGGVGGGVEEGIGLQLGFFQPHQAELRPLRALIILPASLVFNWQRELMKLAPSLFVYVHTGPKRVKDARALASHDVVLTTYHTARQDLSLLEKIGWQFIVLDESQQIKNQASEVSKVVRSLNARHKISLSGTPIENSLADLWAQMEFINPDTLGTFKSFREQFQTPIEKQNDERAKARLFSRVKPFFLRRTKEEVAPDLPELTEQIFYSEMPTEQRKHYEQVKSAVRNEILSLFDDPKTRLMALQALTKLRQLANHPVLAEADYTGASGKMDDVLAQWDVIRRAGHKVLFFSSFEQHLQLFRKKMESDKHPFAWLTGDVPVAERAREVERFQNDASVCAFLMTLGAGGVGLNLTAADYVFLLDPWWNPAKEDQAIARAHRIGRTRPVTAIRFIARDTIEEKIVQLQERKRALSTALFAAGAEFPSLDRDDVEMLLA